LHLRHFSTHCKGALQPVLETQKNGERIARSPSGYGSR
jgi:hypothetical protein